MANMVNKLFLCGVANIFGYNPSSGALVFSSKSMIDGTIDVTVKSNEIRGGMGNQLQLIYFTDSALKLTLTESQFSLNFLSTTFGSTVNTGKNMWQEDSVTLTTGGAGTTSMLPIVQPDISGTSVYGVVTDMYGNQTQVTFTGSAFTLAGGTTGQVVTVRYYTQNNAATYITVPANIIPDCVRIVMDAQLFSSNSSIQNSTLVGTVEVEIPRAQLDGTAKLALTGSGASNTPIVAEATVYSDPTLDSTYYATIAQNITNSTWYSNVIALVGIPNPMTLSTATSPETAVIWAVPAVGNAFLVPKYSDLTFTSSVPATFTVNSSGVLTKVAIGSANLNVTITGKTSVTISIPVTVS
jgi:hypothetical protein